MKRNALAIAVAFCCGMTATASDQQAYYQTTNPHDPGVAQVGYCDCGQASCGCEAAGPTCGCEGPCGCAAEPACGCEGPCGCAAEPACGCEGPCGCGADPGCGVDYCDGGCDSNRGCDRPIGGIFDRECCIGEPRSLFGERLGVALGGWAQLGYHNKALPLFNSRPDEYQLHQAWFYAEKAIDTSCGFDIGGRVDYVYGTDGPDTQAFGIDNNHWDNQWDNGADYGHAIPQAYLEAGYGNWSVKAGHFYTTIGYEVVTAPDNFFYSHSYTMYNSEPFTHTGGLINYSMTEDIEIFGGYVLGWDSGFEDNGDAFLGGASLGLTDDVTLIYSTVAGRFADKTSDERGYMHSIIFDVALSDNLKYISQSDFLDSEDVNDLTVRDTYGLNQYLIYTVNDCLSYGARFEWWNVEADSRGYYGDSLNAAQQLAVQSAATGDYDIYALTLGLNYKPHANVVVRPEIRWDWVDGSLTNLSAADITLLEDNDDRQTTFGVDTIILF